MKKRLILLFFFLLITSPSFGKIPWDRYDFFSNAGGLNDTASPIVIGDNEASDLQNVVFTASGSFETRDGTDNINTSTIGASTSCTGLTFYKTVAGTRYLVEVHSDDKIRKMDYAVGGAPDGTWDDITGALSFAVGQDNLASFTVGEDTLIIEDGLGTTAPYKWTGTGNASALGGSPPNAKVVAYHKRMAFAAGNSSALSTLYFSDIGNIENCTTGLSGNVNIETNDGSVIRALVPGFDALYIFKDSSIWRLSGDDKDTFVLQRMVSDLGTLSPKTVALIGNEIFFQSDQGDIYIYDGSIGVRLISSKVEDTIESANFDRFQYANAVVFDSDFYIAYSTAGSSTHDRLLVFDTFNLAWTKFKGINANALAVADDGTGKDMLIFGDYTGFVYNYPEGTSDNGTAIDAYYVTKQYSLPESKPLKDWKLLKVFADQKGTYNLTVETRTDFETTGKENSVSLAGSASALYGTAVYGTARYGGQDLVIGRIEPNEEGNFFQIKYSNSTVDQPFEIKGFQIFVDSQDRI